MDRDKRSSKFFGSRISSIFNQTHHSADSKSPQASSNPSISRSSKNEKTRSSEPKVLTNNTHAPVTSKPKHVMQPGKRISISSSSQLMTSPSQMSSYRSTPSHQRAEDPVSIEVAPRSRPVSRKPPPDNDEQYLLLKETSRPESPDQIQTHKPKQSLDMKDLLGTIDNELTYFSSASDPQFKEDFTNLTSNVESSPELHKYSDTRDLDINNSKSPSIKNDKDLTHFEPVDEGDETYRASQYLSEEKIGGSSGDNIGANNSQEYYGDFQIDSQDSQRTSLDQWSDPFKSNKDIFSSDGEASIHKINSKNNHIANTDDLYVYNNRSSNSFLNKSQRGSNDEDTCSNYSRGYGSPSVPYPVSSGTSTPMFMPNSPVTDSPKSYKIDQSPFQRSLHLQGSQVSFETSDSISILTPSKSEGGDTINRRYSNIPSRTNSSIFRSSGANSIANSIKPAYHTKTGSISSNISSGSLKTYNLATLKKSFNLHPGEGEQSNYVLSIRRSGGTAYNDSAPGKWKLPTGILPVDKYAATNSTYMRSAGIQSRAKKTTSGVELKHGHLAPRLLATEVDENDTSIPGLDSRLGRIGNSTFTSSRADMRDSRTGSSTMQSSIIEIPDIGSSQQFNDIQSIATNGTEISSRRRSGSVVSSSSSGSISDTNVRFYQHPVYQYNDDSDEDDENDEGNDENGYNMMSNDYEHETGPRLVLANPDSSSDQD